MPSNTFRDQWNAFKKNNAEFEKNYDSKGLGRKLDALQKTWDEGEEALQKLKRLAQQR
jgi:hypothetical protein